jgi:predicted nucleic acid-binding protein
MLYFDTSFLAPLIRGEATSNSIKQFFQQQALGNLAISHWTRVEFCSLLARDVRMDVIAPQTAREFDAQFDAVVAQSFSVILPDLNDFDLCKQYLQRFETGLRAGDALHLAIGHNHQMQAIYSLDKKLLRAGRLLGLPVEAGIRLGGRAR